MLRRTVLFLWNRVEITRPHNLAVAALAILAGWACAGGRGLPLDLLLGLGAGTLVTAAGNVVNDYFDADIDRINKPRRPIPSGRMTPRESRRYYVALVGLADAHVNELDAGVGGLGGALGALDPLEFVDRGVLAVAGAADAFSEKLLEVGVAHIGR